MKRELLKKVSLSTLVVLQLASVGTAAPIFAAENVNPSTETNVQESLAPNAEVPAAESESQEAPEAVESSVAETEEVTEKVTEEVIIEEEAAEAPAVESTEETVEEPAEAVESAAPKMQMRTFAAQAAKVSPYNNVSLIGTINKAGNTIDTLPWGDTGFKTVGRTGDYIGRTVHITRRTTNGAYGYTYIEGLGNVWIDMSAFKIMDFVAVDYYDYVTEGKYEVDTLPWGVEGYQKLANTSRYLGQQLRIRYKTPSGNYLYAELNGKEVGWIDAKAFGLAGEEYTALITKGGYNVDTLPWGTPGYTTIGLTKDYMGLELTVKGATQNGSYLLVYLNGEKLGWIDRRAVEPFETKAVDYMQYVGGGQYEINTLPWGMPGFRKVGNTQTLLGSYVRVTRESLNGAYAYVTLDGVGKGWVDKRAFGLSGSPYRAIITNGSFNVDTLPWGTPGYKTISLAREYMGYELEIKGTTHNGHYALAYLNGEFLGWIDVKALTRTNYKSVNYPLAVSGGQYNIDSLPWGTPGFRKLGTTAAYVGHTLQITKESSDGNYLYATLNGKEVGWIDRKAFGFEKLSYSFYITDGKYNLDTTPWGTMGYKTISLTDALIGRGLTVVARTQNGAYLQVADAYGKVLGWVDTRAGKPLNEKPVNFTATIAKSGYTIDTLPWGTFGFVQRGSTGNHLNKTVTITKESSDGHYWFALDNGQPMGWIDKKAFGSPAKQLSKVIFIDPGHGGSDPGATYYGVMEKTINLQVSMKMKRNLEQAGYSVIMARTGDTALDYKTERSAMANKTNADIFVSVHHNAMPGNTYVNGIETYYYEYDPRYPSVINKEMHNDPERVKESAALSSAIHSALIKETGAYDRGVRRDTFAVLRETAIPAVLLELGFMSNPAENRLLTQDAYQEKLAKAVTDGILAWYNSK